MPKIPDPRKNPLCYATDHPKPSSAHRACTAVAYRSPALKRPSSASPLRDINQDALHGNAVNHVFFNFHEAALADAKNKDADAKRYLDLLPKKAVSTESAEDRATAAKVAKKNVAALEAQKDYKIIRAPLAGTITARFVDVGALIQNAGNSQAAATPVVTVSHVDRLKVYAYADQKTASSIQVGDRAYIWDSTRPEKKVFAALSRTSVQLNARTRTLLLEFDVDNRQGIFTPGSFVQVSLIFQAPTRVEIPAEALNFRDNKPFAVVLGQDNRVNFRPLVIEGSDGKTVKLQSGIEEGEKVALNAGGHLSDGDTVQPIYSNPK
ncbi:MAG: efflux RND transporter periplasmic adaptor subunit [Deltaproteobacteria bacterium]|nr:efflux RND transporter periplasmic adaptor subunit [Deltaproteobacteria bacterium]